MQTIPNTHFIKVTEPGASVIFIRANTVNAVRCCKVRDKDEYLVKIFVTYQRDPIIQAFGNREDLALEAARDIVDASEPAHLFNAEEFYDHE